MLMSSMLMSELADWKGGSRNAGTGIANPLSPVRIREGPLDFNPSQAVLAALLLHPCASRTEQLPIQRLVPPCHSPHVEFGLDTPAPGTPHPLCPFRVADELQDGLRQRRR